MSDFKLGERIFYQNTNHSDQIKHGIFLRDIIRRIGHQGRPQTVLIQLDNNKGPSTVSLWNVHRPAKAGVLSKQMPRLTQPIDRKFIR